MKKLARLLGLTICAVVAALLIRGVWFLTAFRLGECGYELRDAAVRRTLVSGILAQEDHLFFEHGGVNWGQLYQSFTTNFSEMRIARGGSTVAMQVVRICTSGPGEHERGTLVRFVHKLDEIWAALLVGYWYPRVEVLRAYLTSVDLLPDDAVVPDDVPRAFEAAAKYYFSKDASELSDEEEWRLIVTLRSREHFNPKALGSLEQLPPEAREILSRARNRQREVEQRYGDLLRRLPFVQQN